MDLITKLTAHIKKDTNLTSKTVEAILKVIQEKQNRKAFIEFDIEALKGKDGEKPVKGKDYFTEEDINTLCKRVKASLRIPKDGKDAKVNYEKIVAEAVKLIPKPKDGKSMKGKDGKIPVKGVDYLTQTEINKLYREFQEKLLPEFAKNEKAIRTTSQKAIDTLIENPKLIARALEKLKGNDRLSAKAIKGLIRTGGTAIVNATWGTVGGVLADQADLVAALALKLDVTTAASTYLPLAPRVTSVVTSAAPTLNVDTTDEYIITALASACVFGAPTGTPVQGRRFMFRIKDNGSAWAMTYNAAFRNLIAVLPPLTVIGKTIYFLVEYNATDSKYDCLAAGIEP